jgi:hypothetical protein
MEANELRVTLNTEIERIVVIADVRQALHIFDRLGDNVGVSHRHQRQVDVQWLEQILAPGACCIYHGVCLDDT